MDFKLLSLHELLTAIIDNRGKTCPTAESGIPLIATNCINSDRLYPSYDRLRFVSQQTYLEWFRGHPKPGDIIFVNKGTPGRCCWVPDPIDFCIAQDMVALRVDEKKVYPKFLFALLRSSEVQNLIANMHVGTLIPHFKKGDFDKLGLKIPLNRNFQEFVGNMYFNISKRIELNIRMNETLEGIAQALFKSWFVEFDPVKAKAEGRKPEGMDDATAALFPSSFIESPIGPIPEEWKPSSVGECFKLTMGQSPPGNSYNEIGEGIAFYQGRTDFGFRFPMERVYCNAPTRFAEQDDTLISVRAPVGDVNMAWDRCCIGRGVAALRHNSGASSFTYYTSQQLHAHFKNFDSEGTVFGSINKADFAKLPHIEPRDDIIQLYETIAGSLDKRIKTNEDQIRTLTETRDNLLPRLISGKLRVGEISDTVEALAL